MPSLATRKATFLPLRSAMGTLLRRKVSRRCSRGPRCLCQRGLHAVDRKRDGLAGPLRDRAQREEAVHLAVEPLELGWDTCVAQTVGVRLTFVAQRVVRRGD